VSTEPIVLGSWPTPLEPAPRLAAALGLSELWIKRDDLSGLGAGGNKIRKLQYTLAAALAEGATTVVTTGAAQSNHARLTAAAAARLGLRCVLVLAGDEPAARAGNLLLDELAGAEIVWAGGKPPAEVAESIPDAYVIPFGGSSVSSARGYADCARELTAQLPGGFAEVVVAVGSGGTMAGLVAELGVARVRGVHVGAVPDPHAAVAALIPGGGIGRGELRIDMSQVGGGYSTLTPAVRAALTLAARTEGIFLDPTYTGRALAGLAAADDKPSGPVVFLHSGGLPGLFAHPALG
jgi:D-cysteine desulfhydrase